MAAAGSAQAAPRGTGSVLAEARGVVKAYGAESVLDGVSLAVPQGEISVVLGGSGSGKSTLLRILLGLERCDAGQVRLLGEDPQALGPDARAQLMMQVGTLFQFGALFDSMTVFENVGFALREVLHRPEAEVQRSVREKLLLVGLKNVEHLRPSELSGGMRKRVALARAIAHEPRLLFVDEPTTGLDPVMADTIDELILQLRQRLGVTVFCISHDIGASFKLADRIAMLYRGRIVAQGTPEEIRRCPDEVVQQFIAGRAHGPITP